MQSESNEHKLLKVYIATLEKENNARDVERNTLYNQIDRMGEQIKRLNTQLSKSSSSIPKTNKQVAQLKEANLELTNQITLLKQQCQHQASELCKMQKCIIQIQEGKSKAVQASQQNALLLNQTKLEISSLKNQVQGLSLQKNLLQQTNQKYIIQISQFGVERNELQKKINELSNELLMTKSQVIQLQTKNDELRWLEKSSTQISNLHNIKTSLEATIKRLNSKVQWHQSNSKEFQQEKRNWEAKVQQMQLQMYNMNLQLNEYQIRQKDYIHLAAFKAEKQEEIQKLQQINGSLKDNKKYLQKTLKEKSQAIAALEAQVYQFKNQQADLQSLQSQINILLQNKADSDKQTALLIQSNRDLRNDIELRKQKQQGYLAELSSFRREREALLREVDQYRTSLEEARGQIKSYRSKVGDESFRMKEISPRYRAEKDTRDEGNQDIRKIVLCLQLEVQNLKANQSSRPTSMLDNSQVESYLNISNRSQLLIGQNRSPSNRVSDNNERLKMAMNKNKWESLHSKINALRNQNQVLKKTLFD